MGGRAFDAKSQLRLGACVLDLQARELRTADDQPAELRRKALDVLLLLAENAGRVVDKATLMNRVWPGVVVGDDSLTQTVVEIRRLCLEAGVSYLDVNGEIDDFVEALGDDDMARAKRIAIIPGAGFGVVFGEALAAHVARRMPDANVSAGAQSSSLRISVGSIA